MRRLFYLILLCSFAFYLSCDKKKEEVTDIDGNTYRIIKIGEQWWMAENLRVTHYRNDDSIPHLSKKESWWSARSPGYCSYNNDESLAKTYGYLYNWYAVNDARGLAPKGWHVPTFSEWEKLINYLGGLEIAGGKMKEKGLDHWFKPNKGASNESGFSALPGGYRYYNGNFVNAGYYASFWSSEKAQYFRAWEQELQYDNSYANLGWDEMRDGFSVRCVRD